MFRWTVWSRTGTPEKILDQSRYGDNKECINRIHEMHAHTMVSVWPNMNAGGKNHQEFFDAGYLLYERIHTVSFVKRAVEA